MRSLLFVPGDSERKLEKGLSSGADVLIIDLEDSVAAAAKQAALFFAVRRPPRYTLKAAATLFVRV
ncbi:MAG: CoA ester lyase, partial [Rhizobiaceae bacterium]|nr:CoA ester lyase [Rhizobiaceae bacterium]